MGLGFWVERVEAGGREMQGAFRAAGTGIRFTRRAWLLVHVTMWVLRIGTWSTGFREFRLGMGQPGFSQELSKFTFQRELQTLHPKPRTYALKGGIIVVPGLAAVLRLRICQPADLVGEAGARGRNPTP